jgi:hypothetical protein
MYVYRYHASSISSTWSACDTIHHNEIEQPQDDWSGKNVELKKAMILIFGTDLRYPGLVVWQTVCEKDEMSK